MTRVLRLTLLAPDIVETMLDGQQGPEVTLTWVLEPFSMEREGQFQHFALNPAASTFTQAPTQVVVSTRDS